MCSINRDAPQNSDSVSECLNTYVKLMYNIRTFIYENDNDPTLLSPLVCISIIDNHRKPEQKSRIPSTINQASNFAYLIF